MKYKLQLKSISDDELLRRFSALLQKSRHVESELVAHIAEVDDRRLYAREASPSMFSYCTEILNLSEHEAYLRITVARASQQHPILLEMLADGHLHFQLGPDRAVATKAAVVEPLAPSRYKVAFTANSELHDKLERLQALMASSDLAAIIEEAVTEKLERLESKRFGKTKAPRKALEETNTAPSSRYIPAAVKRAVHERDEGQCSFVDDQGRRCKAHYRLEFHHLQPFGRGGDHSLENIRLMCRAHNGYMAERDYGRSKIERYRRPPNRVSEPDPFYYANRDLLRLS